MSKSIQSIECDLAELQKQLSEFKVIYLEKYQHYLEVLSKVARQELIIASYQISTQIYPQKFLEISINNRQCLQEQILVYANGIENRIKKAMDFSYQENTLHELSEQEKKEKHLDSIIKPVDLLMFSQNLELKIKQILNHFSNFVNQYFVETKFFGNNVNTKIIEKYIESQAKKSILNGYNNLVSLPLTLDENDAEEKYQESIIIVHLRLIELEFNNSLLEKERQMIRVFCERLKKLSQIYHQKEQELLVAHAQSAWRTLWQDNNS